MSETPRTKAKINENLELLVQYFEKRFGPLTDVDKEMLYNALDWTAEDVERQDENLLKIASDPKLT